MKHFANLFTELDSTTSTNAKGAALQAYFKVAPPTDAAERPCARGSPTAVRP